jgi:plasmid stabilization system protein ParE
MRHGKWWLALALGLSCVTGTGTALAQYGGAMTEEEEAAERERRKFVRELESLLKAARDAGFPEEEVREITLQRDGKIVNAYEFLEQEKRKTARIESRRLEYRDRYLTVQDIMSEMKSQESVKLDRLREDMVFVGAEEK